MSDLPDHNVVLGMAKSAEAGSMLRWSTYRSRPHRGAKGLERWALIVRSLEWTLDFLADREVLRALPSSRIPGLLEQARANFPDRSDLCAPSEPLEDAIAALLRASRRLSEEVKCVE